LGADRLLHGRDHRSSLRVRVSESGGAGDEAGFGAVGDLEFGENAGDVVADRLLAEEEFGGDLSVAEPFGEQVEDL
jgi:hypothetical protein